MATNTSIFSTWGRNSRLYERYTSNAVEALSSDEQLQEAQAEWEQFFTDSHGDILPCFAA